jgi:hypothetical protein
MKYVPMSRRHFLQGTGGIAMALPFLSSLLSRAEAATLPPQRFFVSTWIGHGGVANENLYPINSTVSGSLTSQSLYAAQSGTPQHNIQYGSLLNLKKTHAQTTSARLLPIQDYDNGAARISPVVGSFVPDSLLAKMNLLLGIDMLFPGGHIQGTLGNFILKSGPASEYPAMNPNQIPTIDYVIGQSSNFYSSVDRALVKAPSVLFNPTKPLSSYPTTGSNWQNPYSATDSTGLYNILFSGVAPSAGTPVNPDATLVDAIYSDFRRLTTSVFGPGKRLGKDDRNILQAYMQNLSDISTRMRAVASAACTIPTLGSGQNYVSIKDGEYYSSWDSTSALRLADQASYFQLINMLIVQAFLCGTTRQVVMGYPGLADIWDPTVFANSPSMFDTSLSDSHHMLFHNFMIQDRQQMITNSHRFVFQNGFMDLVNRLNNASIVSGTSLLDQAVCLWTAESGPATHFAGNLPVILAGGGGGYFKTGYYVDYRNTSREFTDQYGNKLFYNTQAPFYPGLPLNRLLGSICQAMGLTTAEYELADTNYSVKFPSRGGKVPGYGDPFTSMYYVNKVQTTTYPMFMLNDMSLPLPVIAG